MSREDSGHFHQHNHHMNNKEKKGTMGSSDNAKSAAANDIKEDAVSAFQTIPKLLKFFINLGKLFLIFLLETFVIVYLIFSKISFDQVLTYAGYILLMAFVVIPLQILIFSITLPVKIGLVIFSIVSNILNIYKNFWLFIFYGLQFKVLEFEINIEKLEKIKKNNLAPQQETSNLDTKLEKFILNILQFFLTTYQMRIIETALKRKEIGSENLKTNATINGK